MILSQERWMNLRAFKALAEAWATHLADLPYRQLSHALEDRSAELGLY
jgi:hypothetical protein